MNDASDKPKGDNYYGKYSVIFPLIGLASLVLIVCFLVFVSHDAEGRLWAQAIGFLFGGPILVIMTILGLASARASFKKEQCSRLAWAGLILNLCLLALMLYLLLPLVVRLLPVMLHG
jgi:hypothetical protein